VWNYYVHKKSGSFHNIDNIVINAKKKSKNIFKLFHHLLCLYTWTVICVWFLSTNGEEKFYENMLFLFNIPSFLNIWILVICKLMFLILFSQIFFLSVSSHGHINRCKLKLTSNIQRINMVCTYFCVYFKFYRIYNVNVQGWP
jgi:hypothetical protein